MESAPLFHIQESKTMTHTLRPMFQPNGDGYDVSIVGALILGADTVYGNPDETTDEGRKNAQTFIDKILNAAYRGGFFQGDILLTRLAKGKVDRKTMLLAQAACDAVKHDEAAKIMRGCGL